MIRVCIVGLGAIGTFLCHSISHVKHLSIDVVVRTNSHAQLIRNDGTCLWTKEEKLVFMPNKVYVAGEKPDYLYDFVFLCTKHLFSLDWFSLLDSLVYPEKTKLCIVQNGIFIEEKFKNHYPSNLIISIVPQLMVERADDPFAFRHYALNKFIYGIYAGPEFVTPPLQLFNGGLGDFIFSQDIQKVRWEKLLFNSTMNPMSVLLSHLTIITIFNSSAGASLFRNICDELQILSQLDGHPISSSAIQFYKTAISENASHYKTSMRRDFDSHKELEIEAILGNIVRFAAEKNATCPVLTTLYQLLTLFCMKVE